MPEFQKEEKDENADNAQNYELMDIDQTDSLSVVIRVELSPDKFITKRRFFSRKIIYTRAHVLLKKVKM